MKDEQWYGTTLETPGTPMVDAGTGRPLILRSFRFAFKPQPENALKPTKQQLFNSHWDYIKTTIRFDGLVANTDVEPRVVVSKKAYTIFVLCEPKFREIVIDKPQTLQEVFKKKLTK